MSAAENLKAALEGKERGKTVRTVRNKVAVETRQLAEVQASDLIEVAEAVAEPDEIVKALKMGAEAGRRDRTVAVHADDLFHLLDKAPGEGRGRSARKRDGVAD